jgi:hypothetical protein
LRHLWQRWATSMPLQNPRRDCSTLAACMDKSTQLSKRVVE